MPEQQKCEEDYNQVKIDESVYSGLQTLFDLQCGLIHKIQEKHPDSDIVKVMHGECTPEQRQKWMEHMIACMHNELEEVREWFPWKSWKQYKDFETNNVEVKYELIDLLHFLLEMMIFMDMDAEEVFQIFYSKMKQNHNRQENNY